MTVDRKWFYPSIVAHRGGGNIAPENTLTAIRIGHKYGHQMIEFDVKLSKDGIPFLLHDETVNRTTNGKGKAANLLWADLATLDAGSWFSASFKNEPLALLSDVANLCKQLNMQVNIEIKPAKGLEIETGRVVASYAAALFADQSIPPLLSSFSSQALLGAKETSPSLPRGLLMHRWKSDWSVLVDELECYSLHLNYKLITQKRLNQIKQKNLHTLVYTVNDAHLAKSLLTQGIDAICTDNIQMMSPQTSQL